MRPLYLLLTCNLTARSSAKNASGKRFLAVTVDEPCAATGVPRRELESVVGSRRGRMKQGEESAAVKIIKHRYGSTAQIILGTASGFARHVITHQHLCLAKIKKSFL